VREFKEKPDAATAQKYLDSGEYLWNAGIFVWKAKNILASFRQHAKDIYDILASGNDAYNTPGEQAFIDENYPKTRSISVDFAIMENAENVYTLPADIGWSDLGTWASLHAESTKDTHQNVKQGGTVIEQEVNDCLIRIPKDKLALIRGLENYIVVDEGDVLMIYPKDKEQEIKAAGKLVREKTGERYM
jgi:mannose-1-phosphate guanylyltransferase